jgi:hypothetical protein
MIAHCTRRSFTSEQAAAVAGMLGIDLNREGIELEAFRRGMVVELEHGSRDPLTNVTDDDPILTGKIALAHLRELPDYYDRLEEMERRAETRVVDDDPETAHLWLRFEHQFESVDEPVVTVTEAG